MRLKYFVLVLCSLLSNCATSISKSLAADFKDYISCIDDAEKYALRSAELQNIVNADQADRAGGVLTPEAVFCDRTRRMRVGEIFGEGCFKSAQDFAAAALVYQHGDRPEHYFQTFIWSKRAFELGDTRSKRMMALAIDRYLISLGNKQLFGSQAQKPNSESCWCLQKVEASFPEQIRIEFLGVGLPEQYKWVDSLNSNGSCPTENMCNIVLKDTPKGTVPGFW